MEKEVMSRNKLNYILVVDVEATCWQDEPPLGQMSDIIEIGLCILDVKTGKRVERESVLIQPERSKISEYCTQLTTLTQSQVEQGLKFKDTCDTLVSRFRSKDRVWASYGNYDRRQFEQQCKDLSVEYPFSPSHINIKSLVAAVCGLKTEVGMSEALKILGLSLEGTHHRGGDDAWNIAGILSKIILAARTFLNQNQSS